MYTCLISAPVFHSESVAKTTKGCSVVSVNPKLPYVNHVLSLVVHLIYKHTNNHVTKFFFGCKPGPAGSSALCKLGAEYGRALCDE
jgi:hypothetical protein